MAKMGRPKSENAKKKTLSIRVKDALYEPENESTPDHPEQLSLYV